MTTQVLPQVTVPTIRLRIGEFLPLASVLAFQSLLSLSLNNTAFQDEALYLYAGRQYLQALLGGPPVTEPYGTYFSGLPYLHPLIAGLFDTVGGIELARMFSLLCMLGATTLIYFITRALFDRYSAVLAAGLFAVQGAVLMLGRFVTYDAMCVFLLAFATWLALRSDVRQWRFYGVAVGFVVAVMALTKYAGALFAPSVFALMAWQTFRAKGWRSALWRVMSGGVVFVVVLAAPFLLDRSLMGGLTSTTTDRTAIFSMARPEMLSQIIGWCGLIVGLGVIGMITSGRERRITTLVFLGSTLLAPAYHLYSTEAVSLHKHVAFSMFFAAPLAGAGVAWLSGFIGGISPGRRWLTSLAICLFTFNLGFGQAQSLYSQWPNSQAMIQVLLTQVRPSGHILAEESEVPRYYLQNIVGFWQWNQLYWFFYTDHQGHVLSGVNAYKAAIADGYFDLVILRYGPNASVAYQIDGGLQHGSQYELVAKLPFDTTYGPGAYWIWRHIAAPTPVSYF